MRATGLFIIAIIIAFGCKKKKEEEVLAPEIEIISLSETTVQQFNNQVTLTIKYKDNDGDLGYTSSDTLALSVKDSRLNKADKYFVPLLAPINSDIMIEGQLDVQLAPFFLLGNGSSETVTLTVQLEDRSGNLSNETVSPSLTITQ